MSLLGHHHTQAAAAALVRDADSAVTPLRRADEQLTRAPAGMKTKEALR
jgi:hypothetical protein